MRHLSPHRLALVATTFVGLAFAFWLSVFFHDAKRPASAQERADRLAADNYAALSLSAPTPFSPAHWAQRLVSQDPQTGQRHPVAREASALLIAATGGSPRGAAILAFGVACGALVWLLRRGLGLNWPTSLVLISAAMLASARTQGWQMIDPTPWLLLTGSALVFGAWWRYRTAPHPTDARLLGLGLAVLLLSEPALCLLTGLALAVDLRWLRAESRRAGRPPRLPALRPLLAQVGLILLLPCLALLARNQLVTGNLLVSPAADYQARHVTAPSWFWQTERVPQPDLDFVIERYDQLVALPAAQIPTPAYRSLLNTLQTGAHFFGGVGLALFAAASALLLPARLGRPAWLLIGGTALVVFFRFAAPLDWWAIALPPCAALLGLGLQACHRYSPALPRRLLIAFTLTQLATLPSAPVDRPGAEEYSFADNLAQTAKRIRETTPGPHLVFVRLDNTAAATPEPADLPRDWSARDILLARELGPEKDAALVAALPDRTPWRIIVFRDRIGLQRWTAASTDAVAEANATPDDPVPTPEPSTDAAISPAPAAPNSSG